jgi:hypothetical protein
MGMWDNNDEEESFNDMPDEAKIDEHGRPLQSPPAQVQNVVANYRPSNVPAEPTPANTNSRMEAIARARAAAATPEVEEIIEETLEQFGDLDEDFTEVLNDANLRIESGKLYQMIMNHDIFEGLDADPRAVQSVQREIRKFARERMEVMLGMRQEAAPQAAMVSSPFNDLEVDILKKLASKASGGATESPEANQVAAAVREVPKRQTLNTIGGSTGLKKSPTPQKPQAKAAPKLPAKPQAPIARAKKDATIDAILAEEGLTRADVELDYVGIGKDVTQLSDQELADRAAATAKRLASRKTVKSSSAIPMASYEQQEMMAMSMATAAQKAPGMAALLAKVSSMPVKNP